MTFTEYLTIECHLARLTVAAYDSDVRHFKALIQKEVPNDADMVTYLNRLTDDGFATTSIQRKVSAIKLYLFFLRVKQGVEVPDMATLFQPKTSLQLPKLIPSKSLALAVSFSFEGQKQAYRNRLIIALLYYTGCRVSEVVSLPRAHVFSDYILVSGKGGKERMVPLASEVIQRLNVYMGTIGECESKWLFPGRAGRYISRQLVTQILADVKLGCGIMARLTPHTFRHMFATNLLEKGLDLRDIQLLLGHASIQTTQIYTHLDKSKLKRTFNACHPLS